MASRKCPFAFGSCAKPYPETAASRTSDRNIPASYLRSCDKLNPMLAKCLPFLLAAALPAQPLVVRTSTLIDGKGHVLKNKELVIENGRITRVADARQKPTIDLTGLTVMPGWIDTHVHPTWYFNKDGRLEQGPGRNSKSTPQQAALFSAANLYATLM